ncbi:MAG TPA: OmpA family protein [Acetobacteraceae bacterium]|nr:OmpA family protein [Acetobacteraceae bacterium]
MRAVKASLSGFAGALIAGAAWAQPVTGPYVSLGGGANFLQDEQIRGNPFFPGRKLTFDTGVAGAGAVGYGFGNGFRVEVEGNYRQNSLTGITGLGFPAAAGGREQNYGAIGNVIFDMDVGANWIYPYLGVGLGYSWTHLKDINAVAPDGSYDFAVGGTQGHYTYQALFGVSIPVPWVVGLSMTAEYRFYSVVGNTSYPAESLGSEGRDGPRGYGLSTGTFGYRADYNHALMAGLRYELFPPPPPVPPAPTEAPPPTAPAIEQARTYLVFFDWDRADLTARARQIVAEAAQASTHVQTTRIEVNGYTDLSGTATYNQRLSVRRAKSVESELIRDGVAQNEIEIHGYGESNPLVPTAPGVREPQNRRVEIILK